jgi:hypothetical protein
MKTNLINILSAFGSISSGKEFSIQICLKILAVALILGLITALIYRFTKRKVGYSSEFPVTLLILPVIVALVVYFVQDNVAGGLSLAGIFALTRFRSEQKDTEDLSYIFMSVGVGLACGLGYILPAAIICASLLIVLFVIYLTKFGQPSAKCMTLKIIVPEDLNYEGVFDDILDKYCESYHLKTVKTSDFGTMFELKYYINVKNTKSNKQLIDELRTRNGNMNITLVVNRYEAKQ